MGISQFTSLEQSRKDAYNAVVHATTQKQPPANQLLLSSTGICGTSESDSVETLDEAKASMNKKSIVVYDDDERDVSQRSRKSSGKAKTTGVFGSEGRPPHRPHIYTLPRISVAVRKDNREESTLR